MSTTRLVIVGVGAVAGLAAAYLAFNLTSAPQAPQQNVREVIKEVEAFQRAKVLVAAEGLRMGVPISSGQLEWVDWPADTVTPAYVTQEQQPDALEELSGHMPRAQISHGEPIHVSKLVKPGRGYMSSILPSGKRAISTNISVATGAGGFILPNDRVDVLMTRTVDDNTTTETILENIRVLAIDQVIEEQDDGAPVVVGSTATLELTQEQTHILTVGQQIGERLTLSLRSLQDNEQPVTREADYLLGAGRGGTVTIFRNGQKSVEQPR